LNFVCILMSTLRVSFKNNTSKFYTKSNLRTSLKLMASTTSESWRARKHQVAAVITKPLMSRITTLVPYLLLTDLAASTLTLKRGLEGRDFGHPVTDTNTHTTRKFSWLRRLGLDFVRRDDWSIGYEFCL